MSDVDPLSGAYCKEHDIYLCEECVQNKKIHFAFNEIKDSSSQYKAFYISDPMNPDHIFGYINFYPEIMKYVFHANREYLVCFNEVDLDEIAKFLKKLSDDFQRELKKKGLQNGI